MSLTQDSNLQQPSYELYDPEMVTQDTADAHVLLVRLLPAFARQQVGAYYEAAYKRIRVFGEKSIENNKRIRFSKVHTIPEDCDADKLKGQFQEGSITIIIPKKPKELEPAQEQEATKQVIATPQKSTSEVGSEDADMKNGEKGVSEEKPKSEMEKSKESESEPDQEQEAA
ncbi:hypothetical protein QN277_001950 [Acacia crassicarpa]|uniref:SHSP domain-containing protein n=1 Tax=Acacia crassicarpa TaxID=499986 RepID=A0AAE1N8G8_9FABA|nr:hypothetical protein QN277_001950 [Acacia crassicarpa]